jgi:hypothetical protein
MIRTATACVLLSLAAATSAAAWQQRVRITVAVLPAEASDSSLKRAAARLTGALHATVGLSGDFALYDTALTRKATLVLGGQRQVPRLPTQYVCLARVTPSLAGWAQATISFVDAPLKDPIVRLSSPVLLRSDDAFLSFARLAWERLAKAERQRLDSLRTRGR